MNLSEAVAHARAGRGHSIRCPAHDDKAPSLSVRPGTGGNVLIRCFRGCALPAILAAGGIGWQDICAPRKNTPGPACNRRALPAHQTANKARQRAAEEAERAAKRASWPAFDTPTGAELRTLSELRGIPIDGLRLAVDRGILWSATYRRHRAWVLTDSARLAAQARRLDGLRWDATGEAKALTLPGSDGRHPVGLAAIQPAHEAVLLCEGGPDLLAGFAWIIAEGRETDAHAVAILGASSSIADSALPAFRSRRVRIVEHDDEAGRKAGGRWAKQLHGRASQFDCIRFTKLTRDDGKPVKDLNDALRVNADTFEQHSFLWRMVP